MAERSFLVVSAYAVVGVGVLAWSEAELDVANANDRAMHWLTVNPAPKKAVCVYASVSMRETSSLFLSRNHLDLMNSLPSPAASPAPSNTDSQNTLTTQSRKRARSSISSVTSSSKRAMSEDPTTSDSKSDPSRSQPLPTANHVRQVTAMDDIDAYMMEQEAGPSGAPSQIPQPDLPNGVMPGPPSLPVEADAPTFYNDVKYILSTQNQLHVGETWYLVSQSWYRRWEKACTGQVDKEGGVLEGQVGPVDNCELVDNSGRLKAYLQEGTDVVYIPASAWEKLVGRYVVLLIMLNGRVLIDHIGMVNHISNCHVKSFPVESIKKLCSSYTL